MLKILVENSDKIVMPTGSSLVQGARSSPRIFGTCGPLDSTLERAVSLTSYYIPLWSLATSRELKTFYNNDKVIYMNARYHIYTIE